MPREFYQWYEATSDYLQIKFVDSLDSTTIVDGNFVLYDDQATPAIVANAFRPIIIATDFSSISRILTLWWSDTPPPSGEYSLSISNLKTFFSQAITDYSIPFTWVLDSATPVSGSLSETLRPTREPIDVEDYSIKSPDWSFLEVGVQSATPSTFDIIDLAPGLGTHHYVSAQENLGRIDILFSKPVLTNYVTPLYFSLASKEVKRGISLWVAVDTFVTSNPDSTIVSVYLPASEMATPSIPDYSYFKTEEELVGLVFFQPQTKYRLIISTDVGTA